MEVLALVVMGLMNILCFVIGAKVGQTAKQGKEIGIELPTVSPTESIKRHQAKREAQKEQQRMDVIMRNIEGYDGTSSGQQDVPRG